MNIFRRRKFVINKKLQYRLLTISFSYIVLFFVVTGALLFVPLIIDLVKADDSSGKALQAARHFLYLHTKFWPAVFLSLIAIGIHSIRTSHKIAGPLYRLNLIFKAMREGNLPKPIYPRKNDYLLTEIENINQMLQSLRAKVTEIQEAQALLNKAIFECRKAVDHPSRDEIMERIKDLAEKGDQLGDKLGYFKIAS